MVSLKPVSTVTQSPGGDDQYFNHVLTFPKAGNVRAGDG